MKPAKLQGVWIDNNGMHLVVFPENSDTVQRVRLTAKDERLLVETITERWANKAYPGGMEEAKRCAADRAYFEGNGGK